MHTKRMCSKENGFCGSCETCIDPLTGVISRQAWYDLSGIRLTDWADRADLKAVVILADMNRFRVINSTMGNLIGDLMLAEVGRRILAAIPVGAMAGRFGDDEFAVLVPTTGDAAAIGLTVSKSIMECLEKAFIIGERALHVDVSMGAAIYPTHGETHEAVIGRACTALHQAKKIQRKCLFYDHGIGMEEIESDFHLTGMLREAIDKDHFNLVYQPKIDLTTGRLIGAEALLRWKHPELGIISPLQFIPIAEDTGLIHGLTELVLKKAVTQQCAWAEQGHNIRVAVNISPRCLTRTMLAADIARVVADIGGDITMLEVEITEGALMENVEQSIDILTRIHAMGVRIAVDDFGTGYSSLAYLKRLPVHDIKIDKSFVIDMSSDESNHNIARAIVNLSHDFGYKVVAEGIEDAAALRGLRTMHCDSAQGYFISPPLPPDLFIQWIHDGRFLEKFKEFKF